MDERHKPQLVRIRDLGHLLKDLIWAEPSWSLGRVDSIMQTERISRIPVLHGKTELKGTVHYRELAVCIRRANPDDSLSQYRRIYEFNQDLGRIEENQSIFDAIRRLNRHTALLVYRNRNEPLTLLTSRTIADFMGTYAEPFMAVQELEQAIRGMVSHLSQEDLNSVRFDTLDGNQKNVDLGDLTFGEYAVLIGRCWNHLPIASLDKTVIFRHLDECREIRNELMHFRTDPRKIAEKAKIFRKLAISFVVHTTAWQQAEGNNAQRTSGIGPT